MSAKGFAVPSTQYIAAWTQYFHECLLPLLGSGPGVARKKTTSPLPALMELTDRNTYARREGIITVWCAE